MASGPLTLWQRDGERVETMTDFIFWGSKITADSDHSHEIKRHSLLGRNVMTNLDSTEELMLLNCGVGEDSRESLGQQGDPTSPS